jgi:hypothetical protein
MRQVLGFSRKPAAAAAASERPSRAPVLPADVMDLRDELSAILLDLDDQHATTLRHLVVVHDELGARGWPGVEALPARVLRKARIQAEMLASRDPSPMLADFAERLQLVEVAAGVRDGEEPPAGPARPPEEELAEMSRFVEVSDTSFEEYEEMERSWVGTVPSGLGKPGRENWTAPPEGDVQAGPALEKVQPPILVETLEPVAVPESYEMPVMVEKFELPARDARFEPSFGAARSQPAARDARSEQRLPDDWVDFDRD